MIDVYKATESLKYKEKVLEQDGDILLKYNAEYSIVFLEGQSGSYYREIPITAEDAEDILSRKKTTYDVIIAFKNREYTNNRKNKLIKRVTETTIMSEKEKAEMIEQIKLVDDYGTISRMYREFLRKERADLLKR